jgi:hypothetical protein
VVALAASVAGPADGAAGVATTDREPAPPPSSTAITRRSTRVTIVVACVVGTTIALDGGDEAAVRSSVMTDAVVVSSQAGGGCDARTDTMPNIAVALTPVARTRPAGAAFLRFARPIRQSPLQCQR